MVLVGEIVKAKPFLKWVGGKGQLLAQFESLFPKKYKNYFEPFFGGGAVFFDLQPQNQAYINDINKKLVAAYKNIRDSVESVIEVLDLIEEEYLRLDAQERQEYYYEKRTLYNSLHHNDIEKTALLIFLNKTCFNGLYRENKSGNFNVPFGRYANPTICNEENLVAVAEALQATHILSGSFQDAIKHAKKGDFVYLDPPYFPLNATSSFTSYSEGDFRAEDQVKLRDAFKELSKRGCYVMLSNSDSEFIRDLYKEYRQEKVYAGRSINSNGAKRHKITELVVLNY